MGNTCKPMAVSFQCMTKFTTNKKKKRNLDSSVRWLDIIPYSLVHGVGRPDTLRIRITGILLLSIYQEWG